MRSIIIVLTLSAALMAAPALAQSDGPSFVLTHKFRNAYEGVNGATFYAGPVYQTDLLVVLPHGFSADIWGSFGLDNLEYFGDFDDEIDVTLIYKRTIRGVSLHAGLGYFVVPDAGTSFRDVLNPYVRISTTIPLWNNTSLEPYLKWEYYTPWKGDIPRHGWIQRAGSDVKAILGPFTINGSTGVFYDSGAFGFDNGWLAEASITPLWNISTMISLGPSVGWSAPLTELSMRSAGIEYGAMAQFTF